MILTIINVFLETLPSPPMLNLNNSLPESDTRIIIARGGGQGQCLEPYMNRRQHT